MSYSDIYDSAHPEKIAVLEQEAMRRDIRRKIHPLRELLIELTDACNLSCLHCGSSCEADGKYLDTRDVFALIDEVATAYDPPNMRISFTGGEPLLHPDFNKIAEYVISKGFQTGMTTNGTRIDVERAKQLANMGFGVVTISLDGLEQSHDTFRNREGSWKLVLNGMDNLLVAGITPSVTTVANALNINELEDIYQLLQKRNIKVWRVLNVDPIGRAMENPELLLDAAGSVAMWTFIEDKRINHSDELPELTASCSHYLGPVHEMETRNWPFSCRSGVTIASITAKGEFVGCLDVERKDFLVMGHLGCDSFVDAWENGYEPYRKSRVDACEICQVCEHVRYCDGDSMHTWDFDNNIPKLCIGAETAMAALEQKKKAESAKESKSKEGRRFMRKRLDVSELTKEQRVQMVEDAVARIEATRQGSKEGDGENTTCRPCRIKKTWKEQDRAAREYFERHLDDDDADELYDAATIYLKSGLRAGIFITGVAALTLWLVFGRKNKK